MGGSSRSVAGLGVGRDGVLDLLCEVLHPECIDLGLIHHIVAEGPVGVRLCSGLSDLNACSGDGRRRAGAVQAADKALNEILAPLHSLRRKIFDPCDGVGKAALECVEQLAAHALDPVAEAFQNVCTEVQPVKGRDDGDDGLHDFSRILDDEGNALDKPLAQRHDQADRSRQNLGGVVIDKARDVDDNIRDIGEQFRQTIDQSVCDAEDEVDTRRNKVAEVFPQLIREGQDGGQGRGQKLRDALRKAGCEVLQQLRAGL